MLLFYKTNAFEFTCKYDLSVELFRQLGILQTSFPGGNWSVTRVDNP
jgi:hypothetical protein